MLGVGAGVSRAAGAWGRPPPDRRAAGRPAVAARAREPDSGWRLFDTPGRPCARAGGAAAAGRLATVEGGAGDAGRSSPETLAEERLSWVVLACVEGVGERTITHLVAVHGSARHALERAREGRLDPRCAVRGERTCNLPAATVARIAETARDPGAALRGLADAGVWTITALDPDYPARLHDLVDPPAVLFGTGDPAALRAARAVALVGTRHPTPRGRVLAARTAAELAEAGAVVVSGLALGVDGAAHAAVVERRRPTVAVIGAGHHDPGPRAHRSLGKAILETGGAIVSELPPAAAATRGTFPRRNRLISGLADAVVVGEAPARSGALITAHLALEQGRPLFVLQGSRPDDPSSAGCLALLGEADAQPYGGVAVLAAWLGWEAAAPSGAGAGVAVDLAAPEGPGRGTLRGFPSSEGGDGDEDARLSPPETRVAGLLRGGPATANDLVHLTGLPPGIVAAALTLLQIRGLARLHGPLYLPAGALLTPFAGAASAPPSVRTRR